MSSIPGVLLYQHPTPHGNFGDDLNALLWPSLFPHLSQEGGTRLLVGIGTVLDKANRPPAPALVLGSGLVDAAQAPQSRRYDVRWVRGPLSAAAMNLDAPDMALGDPAWLWETLAPPAAPRAQGGTIGLIPHHSTWAGFDWRTVAHAADFQAIDPCRSPLQVVQDLRRCSAVLTESLHGAIFADALGIAWAPVVLGHRFNHFKWLDWTAVIDRPFVPFVIDRPLVARLPPGKAWLNQWRVHGHRLRASGQSAFVPRPTAAATSADVRRVAEQLSGFAAQGARFRCSDAGLVQRHRARMQDRCRAAARDYRLTTTL